MNKMKIKREMKNKKKTVSYKNLNRRLISFRDNK